MSSVTADELEARHRLRRRIAQLINECGGVVALARRAGLSPSTVAQYTTERPGRASEPGALAVLKLARAANVRVEWLVSGEGAKRAGEPQRPRAVDSSLLRLVVEGIEEGLSSAGRTMPSVKKAELVARFYDLFADEPRKADLRKVIALVKAVA